MACEMDPVGNAALLGDLHIAVYVARAGYEKPPVGSMADGVDRNAQALSAPVTANEDRDWIVGKDALTLAHFLASVRIKTELAQLDSARNYGNVSRETWKE